jgi:hypothetical protein
MHRFAITAALCAGCAAPTSLPDGPAPVVPPAATPPEPPPAAVVVRSAPLQLRLDVGGRPIVAPLLKARLADREGLFILDTGAGASVIDKAVAEATKLDVRMTATTVRDASGGEKQAVPIVEAPPIEAEGIGSVPVPRALIVALPPMFAQAGILGIINPQQMGDADTTPVLDLREGELQLLPKAEAQAHATDPRLDDASVHACHEQDDELASFVYALDVTIDGEVVRFELDTGAHQTSFTTKHPIAKRLAANTTEVREVRGAIAKSEASIARDVPIRIGAVTRTLPELRIRQGKPREPSDPACRFFGILGMDVLEGCILVLEQDRFMATCT